MKYFRSFSLFLKHLSQAIIHEKQYVSDLLIRIQNSSTQTCKLYNDNKGVICQLKMIDS